MNSRQIEMILSDVDGSSEVLSHFAQPTLMDDGEWSVSCACGVDLTAATLGDIVEIWFLHTEEDD